MKKLVVYYSLSESTRYIANSIAEATGADVIRIRPKNEIKREGIMKYIQGGRQVLRGEEPELEDFENDLSGYDMIFVGTPVWASSCAPAIKAFLRHVDFRGLEEGKMAFFACCGMSKGNAFEDMKNAISGSEMEIIGEKSFKEPVKGDVKKAKDAMDWAIEIINRIEVYM
ncbi:Flavodoxin [Peptoclostridium litorale DSM 5388]|uniref:Flavodoxin-like domain-containing protein n=1 Tax=Peptoclostridium litorale DSM 5388 TaxID=1121324 RepID=A0A069RHE1_PEPLI|nr:flavodoxin [Peptoclostridium litorale]KDR96441.1 hypothetical protein CLIT_2c00470 [Peptoclostridium litorale DSM 5388]SIN70550.1 Flavodoxin [Peptoclostridium litorale DSM 5388]